MLDDDRGVQRAVLIELFEPDPSPLRAWVGARQREFLGARQSPLLGLGAALAPMALFIGAHFVWRTYFPSASQHWMHGAWIAAFVGFGLWAFRRRKIAFRRENERIVQTVAGLGICPACGYDLLGLEVSSDGCLECPECEAAWRATRVCRTKPLVLSHAATEHLQVWKRMGIESWVSLSTSLWWDCDDRGRRTPSTARNLGDRIAAETDQTARARMMRGGKSRHWREFRRGMLSEGLCPSCAWDLRAIAAQSDGRVECPVCTSAWNAADIAPS